MIMTFYEWSVKACFIKKKLSFIHDHVTWWHTHCPEIRWWPQLQTVLNTLTKLYWIHLQTALTTLTSCIEYTYKLYCNWIHFVTVLIQFNCIERCAVWDCVYGMLIVQAHHCTVQIARTRPPIGENDWIQLNCIEYSLTVLEYSLSVFKYS